MTALEQRCHETARRSRSMSPRSRWRSTLAARVLRSVWRAWHGSSGLRLVRAGGRAARSEQRERRYSGV